MLVLHRVLPPNQHLTVPELSVFRPAGHDRLRNDLCASGERAFAPGDPVVVEGLTLTSPFAPPFAPGQRPFQTGGRFSAKALKPSRPSSEP